MALPARLEAIVDDFATAPADLRVEMLLESSDTLPPLPPDMLGHTEAMEQVVECQTPFFLRARVLGDGTVSLHFDAPREAPTTRGFAGILSEGLNGEAAEQILGVPQDFYLRMGLGEIISPLRLRGMSAILHRLQRQVREALSAAS